MTYGGTPPRTAGVFTAGEGKKEGGHAEALDLADERNIMNDSPHGLRARGAAIWDAVMADLEGEPYDEALVLELCRIADTLEGLAQVVARDGLTTLGSAGQTVIHPAVAEIRQQQQAFARLLTQLNLETVDVGAMLSPRQASAKSAAAKRWKLDDRGA